MKQSTLVSASLATALVVSNAFWAYSFIDSAASYTYLESSYCDAKRTAAQAMALLPVVARKDSTKESILAAARKDLDERPFEKDGFEWIGGIGLRFDDAGQLVDAKASVDPL